MAMELKRDVLPTTVGKPKLSVGNPADRQNLPLWARRLEAMKRNHTMPGDLLEHDPTGFEFTNKEAEKHVTCAWLNIDEMRRRPFMSGFHYDIFEPVTEEVMTEFGLKVQTGERTPEGQPKCGYDLAMYWAPKEAHDQMMHNMSRGARVKELMQREQQATSAKLAEASQSGGRGTGPVGNIHVTDSLEGLKDAQKEELQGMRPVQSDL
jgi:hypothetical protein